MARSSQETANAGAVQGTDSLGPRELPAKIPVGWWIYAPAGWGADVAQVTGGGAKATLTALRRFDRADIWAAFETRAEAEAARDRSKAMHDARHLGWQEANRIRNEAAWALAAYNAETKRLRKEAAMNPEPEAVGPSGRTDASNTPGMSEKSS